ncbi:MAG TPA: glycine/sarcosine/betaine reductase component B subunit [Candidatus Methylomirabilis sp.]|nr:glycine/sarcosine/betaine reductase component B subunit [Candidatus Methylomirabilis sp.]
MRPRCGIILRMNLEIASFRVTDVRFGTATSLRDGVLWLDREALAAHLLEDSRLSRAGIEVVRPGDSVRVIHVLDAVEPRMKVTGGPDFPGFLGRPELVGSGRTHRLDGVAVLSTCDVPSATDSQGLKEAIIDLSGPGAAYTPFGRTVNVVLELAVRQGLSLPEAVAAIRRAALRAAVFMAGATRDGSPDQVETFALGPVAAGLPRVAYVMPTMSEGEVHTTFFYGRGVEPLPAVVHPNEVIDGGLVCADYWIAGHRSATYLYQNEPVIRALYRRHGRDLNFVAVLLCRCLIIAENDKLRQAVQAAKVARMLDLDGAVVTMSNGGHAYVDQMLLCQQLEQAGVATVLGVDEYADTDGRDFPLVTYVPEARAIVSVGNQEEIVEWPAVERVLGGTQFLGGSLQEKGFLRKPAEPLRVALRQIYCATNQLGWSTLRGRAY